MSRLTILTDPNKELRKRAEELSFDEILAPETQELIDNMIETMDEADGLGIAGPQVGEEKRIFIGLIGGESCTCINPEIKSSSLRKTNSEEGCLSVPGVWGIVKRNRQVTVEYLDREGKKQKKKLKGLEAIVFQHELDHLNGVLFIDKLTKTTTEPKTL